MLSKGCISSEISVPDCPNCKLQNWRKRVLDASERRGYLWHICCIKCSSQGTLLSVQKRANAFRHLFIMNTVPGKGVRWEREKELMALLLAVSPPDWRAYSAGHPELLLFTSISSATETKPAWEEVAPSFDPVEQFFIPLSSGHYVREEAC